MGTVAEIISSIGGFLQYEQDKHAIGDYPHTGFTPFMINEPANPS